jgi:small subunit ribosomal protein S17
VSEEQTTERGRRKLRTGVVVSDKADKTVLVRIDRQVRHPKYDKTVRRSTKLAAHDETNDAHLGDTVRVMETRPLSKTKRWRVVEVVERAQ